MRQKKGLAFLLAAALMVCMALPAALARETDDFLGQLEGTYVELFPAITTPAYQELWLEACATYGGEENAQMYAELLQSMCMGTLYGEAAVEAYADGEGMAFNCFFIEGIDRFVFEGNRISGLDAGGETVFSHLYQYVGELASVMDFLLYQTEDADAGIFTYFAFAPDTPEETYHIEFRYGDDRDALAELYEGPYAYWLASGIRQETLAADAPHAIELFCEENLEGIEE